MSDFLRERQAEIEYRSLVMGQQRFLNSLETQGQSAVQPGKFQIDAALPALAAAIEAFVVASGQAGVRRSTAAPYLLQIDPAQAAYLTLRYTIDAAGKGKAMTAIAIRLGSAVEDHLNLVQLGQDAPGLYRKVLDQLKSSTSANHRQGVYRHVVKKFGKVVLSWSKEDKIQIGCKLIELMESTTNIVRLQVMTEGRNKRRARILFTDEATEWFAKGNARAADWNPVHLPMVVPPVNWTGPRTGGYLTGALRRTFMIQSRIPGVLDEVAALDLPEVYAAVNAVQSTAWRVNEALYNVMMEAQEGGERYQELFTALDLPLPLRPVGIDPKAAKETLSLDQQEALKLWKQASAAIYTNNARLKSQRIATAAKLSVARDFLEYKAIYFPHYLDFRGRIYPFSSYLNPQSDDLGRGLLQFSEGKRLGEWGFFWLCVHVANLFGIDKVSFAERVNWTMTNHKRLLDSAFSPLDGEMLWSTAESPWCALAACMEYAGASLAGPTEFVSHLPIAMDGSCSGLQHYSAMLRDPIGGAAVNLVPQEKPGDIYTAVANRAQVFIDGSTDAAAACWKNGKVVRKIAKQPTMTLCYSATIFGMQYQIAAAVEGMGKDYLGAGTNVKKSCTYMAGVIWKSIGETVIAAKDAMAFLRDVSKLASEADVPVRWTTPLGLPIVQKYMGSTVHAVKVHYEGQRLQLEIQEDTKEIDKRRQAAGVAPNFIHSLDSAHLMATVNVGLENDLTHWAVIHDSFGVHAADVDVLHACIREAFIEQYTPNVLQRFRDEIVEQFLGAGKPNLVSRIPPVPQQGTLDIHAVRESAYFFA